MLDRNLTAKAGSTQRRSPANARRPCRTARAAGLLYNTAHGYGDPADGDPITAVLDTGPSSGTLDLDILIDNDVNTVTSDLSAVLISPVGSKLRYRRIQSVNRCFWSTIMYDAD
jgi:hypothetical protein